MRTDTVLIGLVVLSGCLGTTAPAEPLRVSPEEAALPLSVTSNATAKFYEFRLAALDYSHEVLQFSFRPENDTVVELEASFSVPSYGSAADCLVAAYRGSHLRPKEGPPAGAARTSSAFADVSTEASAAHLYSTYDINHVVAAYAAGQTVKPMDTLGTTTGNHRPFGFAGAWIVAGGSELVVQLGGANDGPMAGSVYEGVVQLTAHGPGVLVATPSAPVRCGSGFYGVDGSVVSAGTFLPMAVVGGRVVLETERGATLVFVEPINLFDLEPRSARLLFPGQETQWVTGLASRVWSANVTGTLGFEIDYWTTLYAAYPSWLLMDGHWQTVRHVGPFD